MKIQGRRRRTAFFLKTLACFWETFAVSQFAKCLDVVNVVTREHLSDAARFSKDAAKELRSWIAIVEASRWRNFIEAQSVFKDADSVDGYVIFNIRGNRYRLVTVIHYAKDAPKATNGHIYIRSFLKHSEYDDREKWVPFAGE